MESKDLKHDSEVIGLLSLPGSCAASLFLGQWRDRNHTRGRVSGEAAVPVVHREGAPESTHPVIRASPW